MSKPLGIWVSPRCESLVIMPSAKTKPLHAWFILGYGLPLLLRLSPYYWSLLDAGGSAVTLRPFALSLEIQVASQELPGVSRIVNMLSISEELWWFKMMVNGHSLWSIAMMMVNSYG